MRARAWLINMNFAEVPGLRLLKCYKRNPLFAAALAALLLAAGGCGDKPCLERELHLLDIGFEIVTDAEIPPKAIKAGTRQFRAVALDKGKGLFIKDIPWPEKGSLAVTWSHAPDTKPGSTANLAVSLCRHGKEMKRLGTIQLTAGEEPCYSTNVLAWNGLEHGRGQYDLSFLIADSGESWLCDGGVLHHTEPFEAVDKPERPHLVLILIDTLRADHMGCYGYGRNTTPAIDLVADQGLLFADVWAQTSWTKPSTASILSSLPSYDHGAVKRFDLLADRVWTLSEELKARGYRTCAFVANGWIGNAHFNFNQGYDHFIKVDGADPDVKGRACEVLRRGTEWLARMGDEPCFLFLHLIDPHSPYTPPEEIAAKFDRGFEAGVAPYPTGDNGFRSRPLDENEAKHLVDLYDAEIAAADRSVGCFVESLDELGLRDSTVLVVTSDHGEEFLEHGGLEHGETLFEEQLKVPLIMSGPGVPRSETHGGLVRHIDIAPMALGALDLSVPSRFKGRNALKSGTAPLGWVFADLDKNEHRAIAVRAKGMKLIRTYEPEESARLYDLSSDPLELSDIASEKKTAVEALTRLTLPYEAQVSRPGLYIAVKNNGEIKSFEVQIGGRESPIDEYVIRMCEEMDFFEPMKEIKGARFVLKCDAPDDIDLIYIISETRGSLGMTVTADSAYIEPALVTVGSDGSMEGGWPFMVNDGFEKAIVSPSPPVNLNDLLKPGGAAVLKVLPRDGFDGIPQADIEELKSIGYF